MSAIQQAISDVKAGEYVDLNITIAYDVIEKTHSFGTDWDVFLENAPQAVLHTEFDPCISINDLRECVIRDLERPAPEGEKLPLRDRKGFVSHGRRLVLEREFATRIMTRSEFLTEFSK